MTRRELNKYLLDIKSSVLEMAWPPLVTSARASLVALLYHMEETQWLPKEDIFHAQLRQVEKLAEHAVKHSSSFRDRMMRANLSPTDLSTPEGFRRLPLLTRREIQNAGASLFCAEIPVGQPPLWEISTSGSTGEKLLIRKTQLSILFWVATTLRAHFWQGRDLRKRLMAVRDTTTEVKDLPDWGFPINQLFDTGPCRIVPGPTPVPEYERLIREFRPHYLIVYPSVIAAIMVECRRKGESVSGIEQIITIGEHLRPELRQELEAWFNARVYDVYSSTETGNATTQCPESGLYHVMSENVLLEILDDEGRECAEGQTGRVVVTDLTNYATPLIRYMIGDYAEASGLCPCGRGLPAIKRFVGRERNLAVHPNGERYWPVIGDIMFHKVAPSVHQAQFIQHTLDTLEVRLSTETAVTPAQEDEFRAMIHKVLGYPYKVDFVYFTGLLPLSPSGKFEDFICKVL